MQREKLYNLDRTAYFLVALFYLQNEQNFEWPNLDVEKIESFLVSTVFFGSRVNLLLPGMFMTKTKYTKRCSVKSSTIPIEQL